MRAAPLRPSQRVSDVPGTRRAPINQPTSFANPPPPFSSPPEKYESSPHVRNSLIDVLPFSLSLPHLKCNYLVPRAPRHPIALDPDSFAANTTPGKKMLPWTRG